MRFIFLSVPPFCSFVRSLVQTETAAHEPDLRFGPPTHYHPTHTPSLPFSLLSVLLLLPCLPYRGLSNPLPPHSQVTTCLRGGGRRRRAKATATFTATRKGSPSPNGFSYKMAHLRLGRHARKARATHAPSPARTHARGRLRAAPVRVIWSEVSLTRPSLSKPTAEPPNAFPTSPSHSLTPRTRATSPPACRASSSTSWTRTTPSPQCTSSSGP